MPQGIFTRKPFSTEARKNMALARIGNKNALGKHWRLSEETKKRIGLAKLGKPRTEKTRKKLSEYWKGRPSNGALETYIKTFGPWNKGKTGLYKHSEGTKDKMRNSHKNPSVELRKRRSESQKGEKSHFWKGGITPVNKAVRMSLEYKLWREAVFVRDNFTCVFCGRVGGKLNADHIKRFSDYPELRFAIDNGRTLCVDCHKKTDNYGTKGRVKNKNIKQ